MAGQMSGEFRGKTVETAISAGLAALGLSRDEVEVEVVRPGSRGVLGIGAEDAVVRITAVQPSRPEPEATTRVEAVPAPKVPEPEPKPVQKSSARAPARQEAARSSAAQPAERREPHTESKAPASDKTATAAQQGQVFLAGLLQRMNLRAEIEIVQQSDAEAEEGTQVPVLNIVGEELGVLIGRQNEVLSALELVTRLMVNQQSHTRSDFVVDVNGYRSKRAESLRKLALRMADQAVQTGRTVAMEPMPPAERRIVHLALRDHPAAITQSVGEGDRRKVTIIPRKNSNQS
jgi:spoIIIJ-associated protein